MMIKRKNSQRGFSLVEVLIALVIMSVGMLGIAGLYVTSMQAGRTSMFRHHAVTLAGDVADRIRANPRALGAYASAAGAPGADNSCVGGGVDCIPADMAANDIFLWRNQAIATLPAGTVAVTFTAATPTVPPTYGITIAWNEPSAQVPPTYVLNIPIMPL